MSSLGDIADYRTPHERHQARKKKKPKRVGACKLCGKEFATPYSKKIFCSLECKEQWHADLYIKRKRKARKGREKDGTGII